MAVELTATDYSGTGTGAAATYGTGIYANASEQIKVYIDGALQTIGDDYSLSGIGSAGGVDVLGTFTLGSAVYVERVTPITQLVDTQNNETILEDVLDAAFDKLTLIAQEIGGKAGRALLVPKGETGFTLAPLASRTGLPLKVIGVNPDTGAIEVQGLSSTFKGDTGPANASFSSKAALLASATTNLSAILATVTSGALYTYNSAVTVAQHQALGRKSRFAPPNIAANGAWVTTDGIVRAAAIGISPYNTGAQNLAAWNAWKAEMLTLQDRQELRPLTLVFDEDQYQFPVGTELLVNMQNVLIDGRGCEIVGAGITFDRGALTNPLLYAGIRNVQFRSPGRTALKWRGCPYFYAEKIKVRQMAGGYVPALYGQGSSTSIIVDADIEGCPEGQNPTDLGAGIHIETVIIDRTMTYGGPSLAVPHYTLLVRPNIRRCGSGVFGYEVSSLKIQDGDIENNNFGYFNRGVSIETGVSCVLDETYFEVHNAYDFYSDFTKRVLQVYNRTGNTTNGSAVITNVSSTAGVWIGMPVSGPGIPANSYITSVNTGATTFTINAPATATGVDVALAMGANFENRGLVLRNVKSSGSAESVIIAADVDQCTIDGGFFSGNVRINTAGTTGRMTGGTIVAGAFVNSSNYFSDQRTLFDKDGIKLAVTQGVYNNGQRVLYQRGGLVGDATPAVAAPTMTEFNAFVSKFNLLLDKLGVSGHGLIADP